MVLIPGTLKKTQSLLNFQKIFVAIEIYILHLKAYLMTWEVLMNSIKNKNYT